MSEAVEGRVPVEQRWAGGRWPRVARRAARECVEAEPPPIGTVVGGYRLEKRLGKGGQGTVYRARRGGRLYAIKFLPLGLSERAWRELEVRLKLRRVGTVELLGHGQWPDNGPCFLYLVMPYVHGRPLYAWASEKNPTAREVARLVLELARQLVEIHREGVVHRDVKGANVLMRREDGRPVLVDFGLGTWNGAPEITNPLGLLGTRHYRSPEALRFRRHRAGEHSPVRTSDDLWALGVLLYVLLTGSYPFDTEDVDEGAMADVILYEEPVPPHVLNPRVPRALSELCLRMLEKSREARFPEAGALCTELEAVLAEADAVWDEALCEAWQPDDATTSQKEPLTLEERRARMRRLAARARSRPRRGRPVPPEEASTLPRPKDAPPPGTRTALRRAGIWGGAALMLGLVVGVLTLRLILAHPAPEAPVPTPPVASASPTPEVTRTGQEVAPAREPPEGGRGAEPTRAATPAPVASATPPKDSTRVKTPKQAPEPEKKQQQQTVLDSAAKVLGTVCAVGQVACANPSTEVRPTPPATHLSAECPAGSVEKMRELGLFILGRRMVEHPGHERPDDVFTVRSGPGATLNMAGMAWGKLPRNTVFSGKLFVGDRVYGHFTEAHTPDGHTYPVCLELYDAQTDDERGVFREPGGDTDTARIRGVMVLIAVERFE